MFIYNIISGVMVGILVYRSWDGAPVGYSWDGGLVGYS